MSALVPIGSETPWGKIQMVGFTGGERYYWMVDKDECVSMMPASIVEKLLLQCAERTVKRFGVKKEP